ncbi:hypothetical protein ACFQPA_12865 [Halomarina halobia]|uniref:ArsR family transcriptional regulator n=1 Tax=Halomarina halobia TaxID=3033386 RepID=A0ABD6A9I5_9EURY|nr:hypothetical protein [Halomarina sp. PSR21]
MSERARDNSGKFVETLTPERVLAVMNEVDAPIVTARDVADALDCTPEGATKKLKQLRDQGRVARRKVGGRAVVWWLTDRERTLDTTGDHDSEAPFFAEEPFDEEEGEPIDVADTDELLGDAIAAETETE